MKLAIIQPYVFPYIGYFQLISSVDKFIILDDVNYIVRGWINRNRILVNGKKHTFSIPVKKASQNKLISECEILDKRWEGDFLKTIEFNYSRAPYFEVTRSLLKKILENKETNLSKLIHLQLVQICRYLDIQTEIAETSAVYKNSHMKSQERIIDICLKENAETYYNPEGGIKLYDKMTFQSKGIDLRFLKSIPVSYAQFKNEFIPFLSIIDHMMFNSAEEIKIQLNNFELL